MPPQATLARSPAHRGPNARPVLVVSSDLKLAERVAEQLPAEHVDDMVQALGHLGTADISELPSAVIARVAELEDAPELVAVALRRLAPQAKLLLLAAPDAEPQAIQALHAGFDDYLIEPLDPLALRRSLASAPAARGFAKLHDHQESPAAPCFITPDELLNQPPTLPDAALDAPHTLGDVDLIDRLLRGNEPIRPIALELLRSHIGAATLGWADQAADIPAGHAAIEVVLGEFRFGHLHAPLPATPDTLHPWAGWLAHWLALDRRVNQLWGLAVRDELTGVFNRRYLYRFLDSILQRAGRDRFRVTVLVFDIDDFKRYNDAYGHAAGDEILREAGRLMASVVREHDVVARVGGDEFAVIFWDAEGPRRPHSEHPDSIRKAAVRFQRAICQHKFPKLAEQAPGTLTISGGMAGFPWDGRTADELLQRADEMAIQSKRQGKNVITFGPGAQKTCEILRPDMDV